MTLEAEKFPMWYDRLNATYPGNHQSWKSYQKRLATGKRGAPDMHCGQAEFCTECWEAKLAEYKKG